MILTEHKYRPREAFMPFHVAGKRFSVLVCHRRAGKTHAVVNHMVVRALRTPKPNAFYAYFAPYYGQAKRVAWPKFKEAVANIKGCKISESETSILLPNGSKIQCFGADNSDSLRGSFFDGVICDEFGDWESRAYTEVIRPALSDRQGWAVFIGTPRGKNKFYEMREKARTDTTGHWYYFELKASASGITPQAELEAARQDMDEDEYAQEYECSFDATIRGSYFGKQIIRLQDLGRIRDLAYDLTEPVSVAHDPGRDDAWAMWFWQTVNGEIRFIDYWEESGFDALEILDVLELKPYKYEAWWVPHDALHKTAQSKKSILDTFRAADAPARKVPNPDSGNSVQHGIDAARKVLRTYPIAFDRTRCARGIEALKNYSRKWNPDTKVFGETPSHDQWSHGADAFRYACLSINPTEIARSVERRQKKEQAAERRAQHSQRDESEFVNTRHTTLNELWEARDRVLAARRSEGSPWI